MNVTKYVSQKCKKNIEFVAIRCVLSCSMCTKTRFRSGLCPGHHWGGYDNPQPDPLVGYGEDTYPSH